MPVSFDPGSVAIAGVNLLFLIIGFIEFIKGFFPDAPGRLWLALAFLFGVIGQALAYVQTNGVPATLDDGVAVVVLGILTGLAAAKAYDESIGKRPYRRKVKAPAGDRVFQLMGTAANEGLPTGIVLGADGALYDTSQPLNAPPYQPGTATLTAEFELPEAGDDYDLSDLLNEDDDEAPGRD